MDKNNTLFELLASFNTKAEPKGSGGKQCQTDHEGATGPSERAIRFIIQYAASFEKVRSELVGPVSLYTN